MNKYVSSSVSTLIIISMTCILTAVHCTHTGRDQQVFGTFPDKHTLALWLFDESYYNFTTLVDASENYYDLRLMPHGKIATGKYGNALYMSGDSGHVISYAGFAGKAVNNHIRKPDGRSVVYGVRPKDPRNYCRH